MRVVIAALTVLALAGCSAQQRDYQPIVDVAGSGKTHDQYAFDLNQCQSIAAQQSTTKDAAVSTGVGALAGAAAGTLLGVIGGKPAHGLWQGAALGGLGGLGYGAYKGWAGQDDMVANCLRGRGYSVLGT